MNMLIDPVSFMTTKRKQPEPTKYWQSRLLSPVTLFGMGNNSLDD
jgi:hypothetical protein